ncbi:MAG: DUF4912 domain-containing protein [Planctomycetes bacterium]|nr:DUF4912 domain-containing protein [Planctomycetota bacterium]
MTTASLKEKPVRDLARLAKQHGVAGWHAMRKDQLIRALVRKARSRTPVAAAARSVAVPLLTPMVSPMLTPMLMVSRRAQGVAKAVAAVALTKPKAVAVQVQDPAITQRLKHARDRMLKAKDLSTPPESGRPPRPVRDRMVLMVRGPHWLHVFWELTSRSILRAQAALGQEWHGARPTLRLLQLESGLHASPSERIVREIAVHGGVKNWFIDVREPLRYRCEIGYLSVSGRFHALVRSNAVSTPTSSQGDTLDVHWGEIVDDCERIYAMSGGFSSEHTSDELQELFQERLRRPMGPPAARSNAMDDDDVAGGVTPFDLEVDAELIVYGVTQPGAYVTMQGEPVKVHADGTFRVRIEMPNRRQVLPIVASTADGAARQMVVMAVERNTKSMGLTGRDANE